MSKCCIECFEDKSVQELIRDEGGITDCAFCGATSVVAAETDVLADHFEPWLAAYEPSEPWVHYHPELADGPAGDPLDFLLDEDHPGLFSDRLNDSEKRGLLVQEVLEAIDRYSGPEDPVRSASELWFRRGDTLWDDDDRYLRAPPLKWHSFSQGIQYEWRFIRPERTEDPATYLDTDVLARLVRVFAVGSELYRAVLGGQRDERGRVIGAHEPERMRGPRPEHCTSGGRLNPPGIAVLYTASDIETVVAEIRPWRGAPVSVATLRVQRDLRIIDFAGDRGRADDARPETEDEGVSEVIEAIAAEMAEPVAPHAAEIEYVPTQYVAELIRRAEYDGIAFRSALGPGQNVVLFSLDLVSVSHVELYKVNKIRYESRIMPPDDY